MMAKAKKEDKLVARGLRMEGWSYTHIQRVTFQKIGN